MNFSLMKIFLISLVIFPFYAISFNVWAQNELSAQEEQKRREQGKLEVAKMGKDICVNQGWSDQTKRDILVKWRVSLGDLCGCVQYELNTTLNDKLVSDILIIGHIATSNKSELNQSIVYEYEQKEDSIMNNFMSFIDIATQDCLNKLMVH